MANRSMALKVERARTQAITLGIQEATKSDYLLAPKITSEELARLCENVPVKRLTGNVIVTRRVIVNGKAITVKDTVSTATYARGARKSKGANVCARSDWLGRVPAVRK